jgi:ribosomal protein S18 acetylase RimI-like enzyme
MEIRQAAAQDIQDIGALDHSYETAHVWQMELESAEQKIGARFQPTRLPRSMKVSYPRNVQWITENWRKYAALFVAYENDELLGYMGVKNNVITQAAWISDWAVRTENRRQGVGTELLLAGQKWSIQKKLSNISIEMQSKNMPAVRLVQKMGFEFSGYHDRYYANQDIALFFTKRLV